MVSFLFFSNSKNEVAALQFFYHLVIQTIDPQRNLSKCNRIRSNDELL